MLKGAASVDGSIEHSYEAKMQELLHAYASYRNSYMISGGQERREGNRDLTTIHKADFQYYFVNPHFPVDACLNSM